MWRPCRCSLTAPDATGMKLISHAIFCIVSHLHFCAFPSVHNALWRWQEVFVAVKASGKQKKKQPWIMLPSRGHQSSKSVIFNMCSQYHLGTCEKCKSDRFPPPSAQTCWIRTSGYEAQQPVFWQGQPSTSYVIQMHFRVWEPLSFPSPVELRLGWVSLDCPWPTCHPA